MRLEFSRPFLESLNGKFQSFCGERPRKLQTHRKTHRLTTSRPAQALHIRRNKSLRAALARPPPRPSPVHDPRAAGPGLDFELDVRPRRAASPPNRRAPEESRC
jgi:hypothetical protein